MRHKKGVQKRRRRHFYASSFRLQLCSSEHRIDFFARGHRLLRADFGAGQGARCVSEIGRVFQRFALGQRARERADEGVARTCGVNGVDFEAAHFGRAVARCNHRAVFAQRRDNLSDARLN